MPFHKTNNIRLKILEEIMDWLQDDWFGSLYSDNILDDMRQYVF